MVTVRFFAGARAAARTASEPAEAGSIGELVEVLSSAHGLELERVLVAASFLIDGVSAKPDDALPDGAMVDVLPPFAGG